VGSPRLTAVAELKHEAADGQPGLRGLGSPRLTAVAELKRQGRRGDDPGWRGGSPRLTAVAELKQRWQLWSARTSRRFSTAHRRGRIEAAANRFTSTTGAKVLHGSPPWPN